MSFFRFFIFGVIFLIGGAGEALSQAVSQQCYKQFEVIFPLREPVFDRPSLWRYTKKNEGFERLTNIEVAKDNDIIATGERKSKLNPLDTNIFILKNTPNGKLKFIREDERAGSQTVISTIIEKRWIFIAGNHSDGKGSVVRIAHYSNDGDFIRQKHIKDKNYNLYLSKIIPVNENKSTDKIMIVWAKHKRLENDSHSRIYRINQNGNQIWKRSFMPGASNKLIEITSINEENYLAAGYLEMDGGRLIGWVMKIGNKGEIMWEKNYPRGKEVIFKAVDEYKDGSFVITGRSVPHGNKEKDAAYVIKLDKSGDIIWQRYFIGNYRYSANDVNTIVDGRIELLIDADPIKPWGNGFTRILTVSPNGYLLDDESYAEGNDTTIFKMITDLEGKRFLAGYMQKGYSRGLAEEGKKQSEFFDAWILALPALPSYKNPCIRKTYDRTNE